MDTGSSPAPDAGMPGNEPWPAEDEVSLIQLVNTLLRRRRIIVVTSGGISLFVLLWLLVFSSALTYTSTASFIPQGSAGSASGLAGLAGQFGFQMPANEPGQTPEFYAELITSREVVGVMAEESYRFQVEWGGELEVRSGTLAELLELAEDDPDALARSPIPLHLKGTNFQIKVWEALLRIPQGRVVTYGHVARSIGQPGASRAVGSAVGQNPVSFLIPCHRVIQSLGKTGGYRWGPTRKRAILGWESARVTESAASEHAG